MSNARAWTLEVARAILGDIRTRTAEAVSEVDALLEQRDGLTEGSPEREALEQRINARVSRWVREIEAFGAEAKGAWLVDFDCGSGYYCWRWPEEELLFFHGYEDGFEGRIRIQ